ncbi:uncharacterized protein LOC131162084 [Malania oleifera]|uniref:uncharacterized protein LOC131162084 n=1 Tax=Malania oleifera TaxID=397392 RepID=UPI0025AEB71A|nr:uncharacterized protein LOC131162084 [Malania oleifera]
MKRRRTRIMDLNFDVLKHIIFFVASSSNGAVNFARTICVCKEFMKLAEDADVLRGVDFYNLRLPGTDGSVWKANGLLNRCAYAGNLTALYMLLKNIAERFESTLEIILIQSSKMDIVRQTNSRYCTRARRRAFKSVLEVTREKIVDFEGGYEKFQEILERVQGVMLSLYVEHELALPLVDKITKLKKSLQHIYQEIIELLGIKFSLHLQQEGALPVLDSM